MPAVWTLVCGIERGGRLCHRRVCLLRCCDDGGVLDEWGELRCYFGGGLVGVGYKHWAWIRRC